MALRGSPPALAALKSRVSDRTDVLDPSSSLPAASQRSPMSRVRDHRAAKTAGADVLDRCVEALDRRRAFPRAPTASRAFPGTISGAQVRVDLLPDTMTIRRLPQLWLSTTLLDRNAGLPGLRRPRAPCRHRILFAHLALCAPARDAGRLPGRGADPRRRRRRAPARRPRRDAAHDPRRSARQGDRHHRPRSAHRPPGGEGKRGEHLLLRQSVFENASRAAARSCQRARSAAAPSRAITGAHGRARAA